MYIRRNSRSNRHYVLCESYEEHGYWKHRVLTDLGPDPALHLEYPGGNSFYIKEYVEDRLQSLGAAYTIEELERLFLPFVPPDIRRIYEMFDRKPPPKKWKSLSKEELFRRQKLLHSFDKRRIHYLRCGRVDIGNLDARPWGFLNPLLDKSRDEIETMLQEMERELPLHEIRPYLYTSLHMQRHFSHLLTRNHPTALDQDRLDELFVQDLCMLNTDTRFFQGVEDHDPSTLHPYLVKYLIMYLDSRWDEAYFWHGYEDGFIGTHRFFRSRPRMQKFSANEQEACEILSISLNEFKSMTKDQLIKAYRVRAKQVHPDMGGDKETFVKVKQAYELLMRRKH